MRQAFNRERKGDKGEKTTDDASPLLDDVVGVSTDPNAGSGRRSKRAVLQEREIDLDKVMQAVQGKSADIDLDGALATVQDQLSVPRPAADRPLWDFSDQTQSQTFSSPSTLLDGDWRGESVEPAAESVGMSKFQQQLSGDWNKRVLESQPQRAMSPGLDDYSDWDSPNGRFPAPSSDTYDWNDMDMAAAPPQGPGLPDLDLDLEASFPFPVSAGSGSGLGDASSPALASSLSVLKEMDRDYQRLRRRFLELIVSRESAAGVGAVSVAVDSLYGAASQDQDQAMGTPPASDTNSDTLMPMTTSNLASAVEGMGISPHDRASVFDEQSVLERTSLTGTSLSRRKYWPGRGAQQRNAAIQ